MSRLCLSVRVFSAAVVLLTPVAHAGLPSVYGDLPRNIRNPQGYALIASLDDGNRQVSGHEVYFVPIRQRMTLSGQNWSATVLEGSGRRGGICRSIDIDIQTIESMKQRLRRLQDDSLTSTGSHMTLGRYQLEIQNASRRAEVACVHEASSDCRLARENVARATSALESMYAERGRLASDIGEYYKSYLGYGELFGGNITGIWDDGYRDAKRRLEADNHGLVVKRLPQRQINLYVGGNIQAGSAPSVLAMSHSGITASQQEMNTHPAPLPSGGANAVDQHGVPYLSLSGIEQLVIPSIADDGSSGAFTVALSAIGACGFLQQVENRTATSAVTIVSTSVFPSAARTSLRASYNMWRIFEKIKSVGVDRSGFLGLNRSAYDRVTESMREGEDYQFEFTSESPTDAAMAMAWSRDLKRELLDRVLAVTFEITRDVNMPAMPEPGRLPFNRPVQVGGLGSVIMGVGPLGGFFSGARALVGAIEGTSSAQGSVHSSWNRMVTETWDLNRVLPMLSNVAVEIIP